MSKKPRLASVTEVRLTGVLIILGGLILAVIGDGFVIYNIIPVPLMGLAVLIWGISILFLAKTPNMRQRVGRVIELFSDIGKGTSGRE